MEVAGKKVLIIGAARSGIAAHLGQQSALLHADRDLRLGI